MRRVSALWLTACFGAISACGGSCGGSPAPTPRPSPTAQSPSPRVEAEVKIRDFLFPQRTCVTTLRRSDDHTDDTYSYQIARTTEGHERITVLRRTIDHGNTRESTETYVISDAIAASRPGGPRYPLVAHNLDLLDRHRRIVGIADTLPGPAGILAPCLTTLARADLQHTFRTYETYCQGLGLTRIDSTGDPRHGGGGRTRVYTEIVASTCR